MAIPRPFVHKGPNDTAAAIAAMLAVGERDLLFSDRYRLRAEATLEPLCSRERFVALRDQHAALDRHVATIRRASEQGDWERVRLHAREAALLRASLADTADLLDLAGRAYGSASPPFDPSALAMNGGLVADGDSVDPQCGTLVAQLRLLIVNDPEWAPFYRERLEHFLRRVPGGAAANGTGGAGSPIVEQAIVAALARGDFSEVERLATAASRGMHAPVEENAAWSFSPSRAAALAVPFPAAARQRAAALGLTAETLVLDPGIQACVSAWGGGEPPDAAVAGPAAMRPTLRETLALVLGQPFLTSAGNRYVPLFVPEELLVETFPERDPDARSPLLALLGLSRRRSLCRVAIEDALRRRTGAVCEALGLDPLEFVVACIPFDAYLRLAPRYGWGAGRLWTHFDGYQLAPDRHVRALVGGDVCYGGRDDLCSVGREYDSDHLSARFAIVRRGRFLVYEAG
jgi:hypothetical protein